MVQINKHDLTFILKQIKIAEANSAGTALTEIFVDEAGNVVPAGTPGAVLAISHPLAPYGLRTVDGSYNNLIEGREQWGAADNPFPHVADPSYRDEDDDAMPFPGYVGPDATIPDASGPLVDQNNDYGTPGSVVDADPRIISNLIVDQTLDNPAAIYAALTYAGYSGAALNTALTAIVQAKNALDTAVTNAGAGADRSRHSRRPQPPHNWRRTTHNPWRMPRPHRPRPIRQPTTQRWPRSLPPSRSGTTPSGFTPVY